MVERPFSSVEKMDQTMIERWNEVVSSGDTVYHLGDFALSSKEKVKATCRQLNGYKILLKGNHDRSHEAMLELGFDETYTWTILEGMILTHKPNVFEILRQRIKNPGMWNLHGHTHLSTPKLDSERQRVNMCVEHWDYYPVPLETILKAIGGQNG